MLADQEIKTHTHTHTHTHTTLLGPYHQGICKLFANFETRIYGCLCQQCFAEIERPCVGVGRSDLLLLEKGSRH